MRAFVPILAVAALSVGCGGSQPAEKTYTLYYSALEPKDPPGGVKVKLTVPGGWTEELNAMGAPRFKVRGVDGVLSGVTLAVWPCRADAGCMDKVIGYQWAAEELPATKREELGPGRLFITEDKKLESSGGRRRVHARLCARQESTDSIVMCVIFLSGAEGDKLPELRKVCESVTL